MGCDVPAATLFVINYTHVLLKNEGQRGGKANLIAEALSSGGQVQPNLPDRIEVTRHESRFHQLLHAIDADAVVLGLWVMDDDRGG